MSIILSSILMEDSFFDPRFDMNFCIPQQWQQVKKHTLHMVQDYCISFWEKNVIFQKECCILSRIPPWFVGVLLVEKKTIYNFLKGTLQKNDTCFFVTRGGFIVVLNITFRTGMQYARFMLHTATETHIPFKGRLYYLLREVLHFWKRHVIFCKG